MDNTAVGQGAGAKEAPSKKPTMVREKEWTHNGSSRQNQDCPDVSRDFYTPAKSNSPPEDCKKCTNDDWRLKGTVDRVVNENGTKQTIRPGQKELDPPTE